jgi:hypothetical protein
MCGAWLQEAPQMHNHVWLLKNENIFLRRYDYVGRANRLFFPQKIRNVTFALMTVMR